MRLAENLVGMILFFFGFKECLYFHIITYWRYCAGTAHPLANRQENTITKIRMRAKLLHAWIQYTRGVHKAAGRRLSKTVHGKWKDSHQADWTATGEFLNLKRKRKKPKSSDGARSTKSVGLRPSSRAPPPKKPLPVHFTFWSIESLMWSVSKLVVCLGSSCSAEVAV